MKLSPQHVWRSARLGGRYARLTANLLAGSLYIQGCFSLPRLSGIPNKTLNDLAPFRFWVDDLARSLNIHLSVYGQPMQTAGLFVSNHISWADTVLLNKLKQVSFVARHDLEHWPALGTFTQRMQTVYIDRSNKFQAYRSIPRLEEKLRAGRSVHFFPESTTSDGLAVRPFYPMFFEAAVRTQVPVQPVLIRYTDAQQRPLVEAAYINDDSFMDTMTRMLSVDKVYAHYHFLPELDARAMSRKELARETHRLITEALGQYLLS